MNLIVTGINNKSTSSAARRLSGFDDVWLAQKKEFNLITQPGGILDLHAAISREFHVNRASRALKEFRNVVKHGDFNSAQKQLLDRYTQQITALSYAGMPFCERSLLSPPEAAMFEYKRRKAKKEKRKLSAGSMYVPVIETEFLKATVTLLGHFFQPDSYKEKKKYSLTYNFDSFWAPVTSTQYFGERSVLVVITDPRTLFAELKTNGKISHKLNPEMFCGWYRQSMRFVENAEMENEIVHKFFADRVDENEFFQVLEFLEIPVTDVQITHVQTSAEEQEKLLNAVSDKELDIISSALGEYLQY